MEVLIIHVLLVCMCVVVAAMAAKRNLFGVVVLFSLYSFLMATVMVALDAVDVAMTEAAVGAGVSTILLLGALYLTGNTESEPTKSALAPLAISIAVGLVLAYGMQGLPTFSDPQAPIHSHVAARYLEQGPLETGVPNVVTAVLASYRGYDTLGETVVVFTAGVGVIALLGRATGGRK
jgi:multicomponent Na+:H+ antiporter subunit B